MAKTINEKIAIINGTDNIFNFIVDILGYKNSSNYYVKKNSIFDAEYTIKVDNKDYTIVGIKTFKEKDEKVILKQHLQYWNKNEVPFSILIFPDEVRIYNNFTINKGKRIYSSKQKDNDIFNLFTEKNIATGVLWERFHSIFKKNERVDTYLLNNLRNTIINLYKNYGMELDDAYNFLAQCIFIKYMEDREMLTELAFLKYKVDNFNELLNLEDISLIKDFFINLKERLNGDLFEVNDISWPTKQQFKVIKGFFEAEEIYADNTTQYTMYKYDFSEIPIELISNIYETFFNLDDSLLDKRYSSKNGAYYTPYYLSDFMNDRCLEKYNADNSPVVLDPSCGSGVFLVGAFKRIVNNKKAKQEEVSPEELRKILVNNIYGIDINLKALKLACFSLYIALLDYLTPKDILKNEFKFPNLIGKTLLEYDFFSDKLDEMGINADIIIGNPPWFSDKIGTHNEYCRKNNIPISDGQIAQAFIVRAKDFAKEGGIAELIVTNSIFINENARDYRNYILTNYHILEIFNLYNVRGSLFSHATAPCSILTYKFDIKQKEYSFQYYAFRPNTLSGTFNKMVYDKQNNISVKNTIVSENDYIWRILNNGDEYDVRAIRKIKSHPPISNRRYKYFRGYVVGSKNLKYKPEFLKYKGGNLQEGYNKYLINYDALPQMNVSEFERPRSLEGYLCKNKLLIKRTHNIKLSGAAFCKEPIIFTDDYHCIYDFNASNNSELKLLSAFINSSIFKYYCFFVSKIANSIKPEISKDDIMSFPVPDNIDICDKNELLSSIAKIEDLVKQKFKKQIFEDYQKEEIEYKIEQIQNKIDHIILKTYNLDKVEQETIEYALNYVIPKQDKSEEIMGTDCEKEIYEKYSNYVEQYFNNFLLNSEFRLRRLNIYSQNLFTLISFRIENDVEYGEKEAESNDTLLSNIVDILGLSSIENIDSELLVKNKISGFLDDGFFVIKEINKQNWTLMNAIKDAEYFAKIILSEDGEGFYD